MHDTLDYFSIDPYFRSKNHEKLTFSLMYAFSEKYVLAFSHDEVVHGKKSMLGKMYGDYDQKFATLRALFGYQFAHPGKKLTFMGSEFGQFIEWDYKKQLDWFLLDYPRHGEMRLYARELNRVYASSPAMYEIDGSWDGFCWLNVEEKNRSCIAFMRTGKDAAKPRLVCLCNFTPNASDLSFGLPFPGPLQMILNSDEHRFGGTGLDIPAEYRSEKRPFGAFPYSVSLTLPPLSALYFRYSGS